MTTRDVAIFIISVRGIHNRTSRRLLHLDNYSVDKKKLKFTNSAEWLQD
jgi:hypothetical protein